MRRSPTRRFSRIPSTWWFPALCGASWDFWKGGASGRGFKSFRKAPFVMVASRQKLREVADQILRSRESGPISAMQLRVWRRPKGWRRPEAWA